MSLNQSTKKFSDSKSNKASIKSKAWSELEGERSFLTGDKLLAESAYWVR